MQGGLEMSLSGKWLLDCSACGLIAGTVLAQPKSAFAFFMPICLLCCLSAMQSMGGFLAARKSMWQCLDDCNGLLRAEMELLCLAGEKPFRWSQSRPAHLPRLGRCNAILAYLSR